MKKILALLLATVGLMTFTLTGCSQEEDKPGDSDVVIQRPVTENFIQNIKCRFSPTVTTYSVGEQTYISKTISATVQPENASNKEIDYEVCWQSDAERKNEDVKNYVDVVQDSDGSLNATVYCYQPFGNDKITICATARDGGAKGYCTVSYLGIASEMKIETSLNKKHNEARGDYYELLTNQSYDFDVVLSNVFGENVSSNLTYEVRGYGAMTIGQWLPINMFNKIGHNSQFLQLYRDITGEFLPIDRYISSDIDGKNISIVTNSNGFTPGTYVDFYNVNAMGGPAWADSKSYAVIPAYDEAVVEEFATRVGLQLQKGDYFSLTGGQGYSFYSYEDFVLDSDYGEVNGRHNPTGATFEQYVNEPGAWMIEFYSESHNQQACLDSYYFELLVTDTISGITASIKFVINTALDGINLPDIAF